MISSIDHLIIAVKDINEAEENYRKIFEWSCLERRT